MTCLLFIVYLCVLCSLEPSVGAISSDLLSNSFPPVRKMISRSKWFQTVPNYKGHISRMPFDLCLHWGIGPQQLGLCIFFLEPTRSSNSLSADSIPVTHGRHFERHLGIYSIRNQGYIKMVWGRSGEKIAVWSQNRVSVRARGRSRGSVRARGRVRGRGTAGTGLGTGLGVGVRVRLGLNTCYKKKFSPAPSKPLAGKNNK